MNRKFIAGLAGMAVLVAGSGVAVAANSSAAPKTVTVKQSFGLKMVPNRYFQSQMRWDKDVYRVKSGGTLVFLFNKDQEGPHSLSVVRARDLPDNAREATNCKACNAAGQAHGFPEDDGPPKYPFVENGTGQDTPPNLDRPGDSALTGPQKGSKVTMKVTAKAGRTLSLLCAIHPQMQAKLRVLK